MEDHERFDQFSEYIWNSIKVDPEKIALALSDSYDAIRADALDFLISNPEFISENSDLLRIPEIDESSMVNGRLRLYYSILKNYDEEDIAMFGGIKCFSDLLWHWAAMYLSKKEEIFRLFIELAAQKMGYPEKSLAENLLKDYFCEEK